MKTRKESEYIICSLCKKAIIIAKFDPVNHNPVVNYDLSPFNPYELPPYHPQYLERDFEVALVQEKMQAQQEKVRQMALNRFSTPRHNKTFEFTPVKKSQVYKPLMDTVKEITERIKYSGYVPLNQKEKKNLSEELEEKSWFSDQGYMSSFRSRLPKIY